MKKYLLFIILCILFFCFSQAQTFEWSKAGNSIEASKMVCDKTGNFYVVSGSGPSKYDSIGNFIWQQNITGTDYKITGIAVDIFSNLYITGAFGGTVNIGINTFISEAGGDANMFFVKYNTNGTIQWITHSHSNRDSGADAITIDKQGNPIITGRFYDSLRLDAFVFKAPETNQMFLAKYSPSGVCLWAKHLVSGSFDGGYPGSNCQIKSDKLGNTYISGHYIGDSAQFDNINIVPYHYGSSLGQDIFLAKIDSTGNFLWIKNIGGLGQEISGPMDVDSLGNTYISGYFSSAPTYFGSYTLTTNWDGYFTAKYDTDGNCLWAKYGAAAAICAANDGYYTNFPDYIRKYDTLGNLQWTKTVAGATNNAMVANNTDVYITGSYTGSVNFDTCALSSTSNQMYIAKLSNPNPPIITNLMETESRTNFFVFPNPTSRIITINLTTTNVKESYTLKVSDSLGKNVYSETLKEISASFTKQIDLSQLPKGIYFLELQSTSPEFPQLQDRFKKIVLQ